MIFSKAAVIIVKKEESQMSKRDNKVRVMITSSAEGTTAAREFTEIYREMFDVMFREIMDFEEALREAEAAAMTHMLYFRDNGNLVLTSLADEMGGYSLDITVDDLRRVLS